MSTTTTTTTTTKVRRTKTPASVATVLQDYELCHSGALGSSTQEAPSPLPAVSTVNANPPGWDTTHRRVPSYRPINRARDPAEVNVYQNGIERAFITTLFAGLFVNAVSQGRKRQDRSGSRWKETHVLILTTRIDGSQDLAGSIRASGN